jgi:hypothetical protein
MNLCAKDPVRRSPSTQDLRQAVNHIGIAKNFANARPMLHVRVEILDWVAGDLCSSEHLDEKSASRALHAANQIAATWLPQF